MLLENLSFKLYRYIHGSEGTVALSLSYNKTKLYGGLLETVP